jgi:uncharacterized protein YbdZ (MbtH family)
VHLHFPLFPDRAAPLAGFRAVCRKGSERRSAADPREMDRTVARFEVGAEAATELEKGHAALTVPGGWNIRGRPHSNVCHFQGQSRLQKTAS